MYILPLAAATLLVTTTTTADAYTSNMYGGRNRCNPSSNFVSSKRAERYRQRQQRVDDAFRELQKEMNESFNNGPQRRRRRGDRFDRSSPSSRTSPFSGPQMFMMDVPPGAFYQEVDKDQMKKWIGKAFNLASEWNDDFAASDQDKDANKEFLEKSKEWVDRLYDAQEEVSQERTTVKDPASSQQQNEEFSNPETTNEWYDMAKNADSTVNKKSKDPETSEGTDESSSTPTKPETPYSENRSDDTMFQVAVDLPGVEREDIDISFKGDFLTIEAERRPTLTDDEAEGEGRQQRVGQGRKFMKRFVLIEDEVEIDQIDASLKNGILMVSAPKKAKVEEEEQEEPPRKININ